MAVNHQKDHRQRVKKRYINEGLDSFDPQHVLELLLFYGIPQKDTKGIAYALLDRFGSFKAVLEAPYQELIKVKGMGEHSAILISMIPKLARYYLNEETKDTTIIDSTKSAGEFFKNKFVGHSNEVVYALYLDNKKKPLLCKMINEGTVNSTNITIRKIVEQAIAVNAASVIISHNHPSGFAIPSMTDIKTTRELITALGKLEINLVDHIIVGNNDYVSMIESGFI